MSTPHDWITPAWPAPPSVRALITTRNGGVSTGTHASFNLGLHCGDEEAAVLANRRLLRALLPQEPRWLRQVHGVRVIVADDCTETPQADAAVTRRAQTVCVVMVADCMPVFLCNRAGTVIGVAHAGWRGLSAGVVEATVAHMRVPAGDLLAYLGPAIGPAAFEVGTDVRDAFSAADPDAIAAFVPRGDGKWLADLFQLARRRLARCGVERIYGGGICTYSEPARFFSYRRERTTGRMAALIWMEAARRTGLDT